jgi:uncharacterized Ntn-hydrolase superfamily protein
MTFSIVAHAGGEVGVAVQTAMFGVGAIVPWARAGVGAVATQAFSEPAYGPRCLDALAAGHTASEALAAAAAEDPLPMLRQVGVVGVDGSVAASTGSWCVDHAGDVQGDGFTVQANMVASPEVWTAMAGAFRDTDGPLARRLLAALVAGQDAGGDARGEMSAALLVVNDVLPAQPGAGVVVDVRVDRAAAPIEDLTRLLDAADAYASFNRAVELLTSGQGDEALAAIDRALTVLPGEENLRFVRVGALVATGQTTAGVAEARALLAGRPTWEVIVRSFADKGMLGPLPEGTTVDDLFAGS